MTSLGDAPATWSLNSETLDWSRSTMALLFLEEFGLVVQQSWTKHGPSCGANRLDSQHSTASATTEFEFLGQQRCDGSVVHDSGGRPPPDAARNFLAANRCNPAVVAPSLLTNRSLRKLDVSYNRMSYRGCVALLRSCALDAPACKN